MFLGAVCAFALIGSLLAVPTAAPAETAAQKPWRPTTGGFFNDPWGTTDQKFHIERQIVGAIRHAKKGSYIRIAVYSFDRTNVAQALIDAHKRGVRVQVLHNDHQVTKAMMMLKRALGTNRQKKSWDYTCKTGCRSNQGVLHDKVYLFEHTGAARNVVMTGSHNLTRNATVHQFNDLLVKNDVPELYGQFLKLFGQLKKDKRAHPLYWHKEVGTFKLLVYPHPRTTSKNDPIMQVLDQVQCHGATGGTGINGRTKIRVSMHSWNGDRGTYIARKLRHLYAAGCNVKVMWALAGSGMKKVIGMKTPRGEIRRHANGYDMDCDPLHEVDMYSHQKYMTISGHFGDDRAVSRVYTGSSNWTHSGVVGDEIVLRASGKHLVNQWNRNFEHIWTKRSRPVGGGSGGFHPAKPLCPGSTTRTARTAPTGPLSFSGEHWEDD
ncbi:phospholipase D-like domain-containing protein [Nocardioides sp. CN2-186]|uniref:phospholipase D-like domain-containing protein n=1 Tax=Nocardioides tweenelious TaxID=3156607 RepID=UPI0032B333F3